MAQTDKDQKEEKQEQEQQKEEQKPKTEDSKKDVKKEKNEAKQEQAQPKDSKEETPSSKIPEEKEEQEEVDVPEKFQDIVQKIEQLSVLDLSELVKVLEKKFGVSAQPQIVSGGPVQPGSSAGTEGESEKSEYDILLKEVGEKKIEVIKVVRDITNKGLKEAKDIVDAVKDGPQEIKKSVPKEEAEEIKKKLEEAGATVELK